MIDTAATPATDPRSALQPRSALRGWAPALVAIAVAAAGFGVVFAHEVEGAIRVWMQSTAYNHCFLVLPMAAFLVWERRALLPGLRPEPTAWPLLIVPVLGAIWAGAAILDILEGEQLVMVALFEVILFSLLGRRVFSALLAPLLFLFFLVPFGGFLVPWLQQVTTHFAVVGLHLVNIPVFANGFVIEIPEGTFEVAEACAGLRFLIASLVFGCFFATIVYRSLWRRLGFIVLSVVVPIVANGLRAFGLIALAHVAGSAAAVETDHVLYGWLFFTLVTLVLIGIGLSFRDRQTAPSLQPVPVPYSSPARCSLIAAGSLALAFAAPVCLDFIGGANSAVLPNSAWPSVSSDAAWVRQDAVVTSWHPSTAGADRDLAATYRDGSAEVTAFVRTYRLRLRNGQLTSTTNRFSDGKVWYIQSRGEETTAVHGGRITVNTAAIGGNGHSVLVWWFYRIGPRTTASLLEAKLLQARALLTGNEDFGELVAISTPLRSSADAARARLGKFLIGLDAAQN